MSDDERVKWYNGGVIENHHVSLDATGKTLFLDLMFYAGEEQRNLRYDLSVDTAKSLLHQIAMTLASLGIEHIEPSEPVTKQ